MIRTWATSLLALAAAAVWTSIFVDSPHSGDWLAFLITGLMAIPAGLVFVRSVPAQIMARGALWMSLCLTVVIAHVDAGVRECVTPALLSLALLAAGRGALQSQSSRFQPEHHRGILTLGLVLGAADALALSFWTLGGVAGDRLVSSFVLGSCALAIGIGAIGLYRLRLWGLLLSLAANAAVLGICLSDALKMDFLRYIFIVPSVVQLLLPIPVLVAIVRRRPVTAPAWLTPVLRLAPTAALCVMLFLALQPLFVDTPFLHTVYRWLR